MYHCRGRIIYAHLWCLHGSHFRSYKFLDLAGNRLFGFQTNSFRWKCSEWFRMSSVALTAGILHAPKTNRACKFIIIGVDIDRDEWGVGPRDRTGGGPACPHSPHTSASKQRRTCAINIRKMNPGLWAEAQWCVAVDESYLAGHWCHLEMRWGGDDEEAVQNRK